MVDSHNTTPESTEAPGAITRPTFLWSDVTTPDPTLPPGREVSKGRSTVELLLSLRP